MTTIRFASVDDTCRLMNFMHHHWRADHILSRNETLFRYDFQEGDRLNMAIATDADDEIIGLFGFMKYNSLPVPDLAGSLWKVIEGSSEPLLGLRLRRFVMSNVDHRYFAAPGAGLQTRPIYRTIDVDWLEMEHYYLRNPAVSESRLSCAPAHATSLPSLRGKRTYQMRAVEDPVSLVSFPFLRFATYGPLKDLAYVSRRFFRHPIYRYRLFQLSLGTNAVNLVVCREVAHGGGRALRMVDFFGDERHMPAVVAGMCDLMSREGHEYLDFVCAGFDPKVMRSAAWQCLDFGNDQIIVPNYFEPFVRSNVRVYAVADRHASIRPRLCRGDGDQDRPNFDAPAALDVAS